MDAERRARAAPRQLDPPAIFLKNRGVRLRFFRTQLFCMRKYRRGGYARARLDTLIELDYIAPTRNFDAAANQPYRYVIADPAVRFYHGLVLPYRNAVVHGDAAGTVWRDVVIPRLDSYLGHTFEVIARQASVRVRERSSKALPLVKDWGRWEGRDRTRTPIEIDIVARAVGGSMITGAVKWNARPVSSTLHTRHVEMVQRLAASGHRWAHEALSHDAILLYVSASGFSEAFAAVVADEPRRVVTWSLNDMYGGPPAASRGTGDNVRA